MPIFHSISRRCTVIRSPTATGPPERLTAITDKVIPVMREWQNRPLESLYVLVWLDGIYYKVRHEGKVVTRVLYSVIGLTLSGKKQVLAVRRCGIYTAQSESAKFWLSVLTDLEQRGGGRPADHVRRWFEPGGRSQASIRPSTVFSRPLRSSFVLSINSATLSVSYLISY